jgi:hypothetical protein
LTRAFVAADGDARGVGLAFEGEGFPPGTGGGPAPPLRALRLGRGGPAGGGELDKLPAAPLETGDPAVDAVAHAEESSSPEAAAA